jgi:hypothetical protein
VEQLRRTDRDTAGRDATIRRFRQRHGFPVTFVGFGLKLDRSPAGHKTVWFDPSMAVTFNYGTDYEPVKVDEDHIARTIDEMDASELGVIIANAQVRVAVC